MTESYLLLLSLYQKNYIMLDPESGPCRIASLGNQTLGKIEKRVWEIGWGGSGSRDYRIASLGNQTLGKKIPIFPRVWFPRL